MKNIKTIGVAALALALCVALLGCGLVSVDEEKDMAQIVAKVGDVEITKEQFVNEFNYYYSLYTQFGYDPTTDEESLRDFQKSILDGLIGTEVQKYQAKLQGYDQFSDEQLAEFAASAQESLGSFMEMCREEVASTDETLEGEALEAAALEQFPQLTSYYYGREFESPEALSEWLTEQYRLDDMVTRMQDEFNATVTVTDGEVKAAYDEMLETAKTTYDETPGDYKADQEYYESYGEEPVLYAPEGYIRVKHILVSPEGTLDESYDEKIAKMTELESELGALSLAEEVEDPTRIDTIRSEYQALKAETDQILADYTKDAKAKAEEAYAKLQAGESFDKVMAAYTQDEDMKGDVFKDKGKLMSSHDSASDWPEALKIAVLVLTEKGGYTEVLTDAESHSFHIFQYVSDEPAGERPFADFEAAIKDSTLEAKQEEEWYALLDTWIADSTVVTRFEEVLRSTDAVG